MSLLIRLRFEFLFGKKYLSFMCLIFKETLKGSKSNSRVRSARVKLKHEYSFWRHFAPKWWQKWVWSSNFKH